MNIFEEIYAKDIWKGGSGQGSNPAKLIAYLAYLQMFLAEQRIASIVDVGCGDWQHMRRIDLSGIKYIGIDCVPLVVDANSREHSKDNVRFVLGDVISMDLPPADLLICKDVLQHNTNDDVLIFLKQLPKFRYCLITNDFGSNVRDVTKHTGHYAALDCQASPFCLSGDVVLKIDFRWVCKHVLLVKNHGLEG